MDLEIARKVVGAYGGFIEWARWRLNAIYFSGIPNSLLPYSVELTEQACSVVARYYYERGDKEKVEDIERCVVFLGEFKKDEEALLVTLERLKAQKWYDCSIKIISSCRDVEKKHISGFFKDVAFEKVDFENLNFYTACKIVEIYGEYLKHAHMRLSFAFCQQIPESLLPFSKENFEKALDFYTNLYDLTGNERNSEVYTSGKTILEEDYVADEIAIKQLIKNLSDDKIRRSVIFDMKKFQLKTLNAEHLS